MMRVTNKMLVNELNRSLANNLLRMDKYQRQLSTTRRINTPSDDPAGLVKSLRLRTNLTEGEQYLANINESLGFLDTTDAAFGNINEILHDAREMAVKASTDSNVKPDFAAMAKKIREMNEQLKMIANSTYGSKYIFAGSNITETPYENEKWRGNSEVLETEIGVGVKIPYNIDAREFFIGRLDELQVDPVSGINAEKVVGKNLQEGNYQINCSSGVSSEVDNQLNAVDNNGKFFFYEDAVTGKAKPASIVGSRASGTMGSPYDGYLEFEVKAVHPSDDPNPALQNTLEVNIKGRLAIGNGEYKDINIVGKSLNMAAADDGEILTISAADLEIGGLTGATRDLVLWNNSGSALAGIDAANPQFAVGDSAKIKLSAVQDTAQVVNKELSSADNKGMFFFYDNAAGNAMAANLAGGSTEGATDSSYHGYINMEVVAGGVNAAADQLTVNISGQLAIGDGTYQNITLNNVTLQMNAGSGAAICSINAADLEAGGLTGAIQDLVLWNNSGSALAGIDDSNPEFVDGDKVGIQLSLPLAPSSASESQSYLSAVPNAGSFFYEDMGKAATLGVGAGTGSLSMANGLSRPFANDAPYSGSLLIEAKKLDLANGKIGPRVTTVDTPAANLNQTTLTLSRALYMKDKNGDMVAISDNTDLKDYFNFQRANGDLLSGAITSAIYDVDSKQITLTFDNDVANNTDLQAGDSVSWNNDWDSNAGSTVAESGKAQLYDQYGNEFQRVDDKGNQNLPLKMTCNSAGPPPGWNYEDKYESSKITVDIKGHLYTGDGKYKYVELENIVIDSEAACNEKIIKISAADINDPDFTEDLVIWNNGVDTLGGIDPDSPQIKVGDKTVISFARQGDANSQNVEINFNYKAADGTLVEGSQRMKFDNATFDYHTRELQFFTLNEETGLAYSGEIAIETGVFGARDSAVSFSWRDGLFGYMEDLARKIEAGKVSETSLQIGGDDRRMEELLLYRSTVGARVNRLELQQSRLESIQETFTSLLSKTEDANMAEVIMQLQLQENVYRASLAAGARIIQPSLLDFLR